MERRRALVRRISAKEARNRFSDLIGSVYYSKEPVIVEKQGRPFAVVISPEEYDQFVKDWEADFAILDEIWAKSAEVSPGEVEADVAREIAAYRRERRRKAKEPRGA
jgi:prevent-host-death family protein